MNGLLSSTKDGTIQSEFDENYDTNYVSAELQVGILKQRCVEHAWYVIILSMQFIMCHLYAHLFLLFYYRIKCDIY